MKEDKDLEEWDEFVLKKIDDFVSALPVFLFLIFMALFFLWVWLEVIN